MSRRIKEDPKVHRERIASAAEKLFMKRGVENTTVNSISEAAGYSKATVYVYFKNKEDIVSYLVLKSMTVLYDAIVENTSESLSKKENFLKLCETLLSYKDKYPMYFELLQDNINSDFDDIPAEEASGHDRETWLIGEKINAHIIKLMGIKKNSFETVFMLWAALCGVIKMVDLKKDYIEKSLNRPARDYLNDVFERLYVLV